MSIRTILVSQPKPVSENSPYFELAKKYNLTIDFRPFIQVEGAKAKEVRKQRVNFEDYSAVIFTSKIAVDHFFRIAEEEVINFLELVPGKDVTPRDDNFEDKDDEVAFEKATKVAQRFSMEMVNIPVGSELMFIRDEDVKCKVKPNNRVDFEGEDHSLSSAALIATNRMGFNWGAISGPLNWKYEGETLAERRARLESND